MSLHFNTNSLDIPNDMCFLYKFRWLNMLDTSTYLIRSCELERDLVEFDANVVLFDLCCFDFTY